MAEPQEIPTGTFNLKLGSTFDSKSTNPSYHTLRFDFKPKSLASGKDSFLAFGSSGNVQIVAPNETESVTLYKGSQKPVKTAKECLLFFDKNTGEFRLEKLSSIISVKKSRDQEEFTSSSLFKQIEELRQKDEPAVEENMEEDTVSQKDGEKSPTLSSSGSEESESDSDNEAPVREASRNSNPSHSTDDESQHDADDMDDEEDDQLESALEQQLNSFSMPDIDSVANMKSSNCSSPVNSKRILHDDLHLSESSDED